MSSFEDYFDNESLNLANCYENLEEICYQNHKDQDFYHFDKSEQPLIATNYTQRPQKKCQEISENPRQIEVSSETLQRYLSTKKGQPNETMELLPNFKTFLVRKIKDLLLIRVLNKEQTTNCLNFMRSKPSFHSLKSLFSTNQTSQNLNQRMLQYFSSAQLIHFLMKSSMRMTQKRRMIKFIERMRNNISRPDLQGKWKQWYQ